MTENKSIVGAENLQPLRRHSIRLKGYDYSQAGAYFITICVKDRKCLLGEVINGEIILSDIGKIIEECWNKIPTHFNSVNLDAFVVMPNHLHGIVLITDNRRGVQLNAPTIMNFYKLISPKQNTLSVIIRTFKAVVTTHSRKNNYPSFQWQRNYYEHIIRSEDELNSIREYILNNPLHWQFDRENARRIPPDKAHCDRWGQIEEEIYGKPSGQEPKILKIT